jgi:hypothetical protein
MGRYQGTARHTYGHTSARAVDAVSVRTYKNNQPSFHVSTTLPQSPDFMAAKPFSKSRKP